MFAAGYTERAKKVANCNRDYFALACSNGTVLKSFPLSAAVIDFISIAQLRVSEENALIDT